MPVVGTIDRRPELEPHAAEVDRILWVPLADLLAPGTFARSGVNPPLERPIFFFELDDETVWGATARMLHQLLRVAHGIDEPRATGVVRCPGQPATSHRCVERLRPHRSTMASRTTGVPGSGPSCREELLVDPLRLVPFQ